MLSSALGRVAMASLLLASTTYAFLNPIPMTATTTTTAARRMAPLMALDPELSKTYPRDFKNIPIGTQYGKEQHGMMMSWGDGMKHIHIYTFVVGVV